MSYVKLLILPWPLRAYPIKIFVMHNLLEKKGYI